MDTIKSMLICLANCKSFSDLIISKKIQKDIKTDDGHRFIYQATRSFIEASHKSPLSDNLAKFRPITFMSILRILIRNNELKLPISDDILTNPKFSELLYVYLKMLHFC